MFLRLMLLAASSVMSFVPALASQYRDQAEPALEQVSAPVEMMATIGISSLGFLFLAASVFAVFRLVSRRKWTGR